MGVIELLLVLAAIGLVAWALTTWVPMAPAMKTVIIAAAVLFSVLIVLRALGLDVPIQRLR